MANPESSTERRLKAESEFQNRRVASLVAGKTEPRDRFYYLADRALEHYHQTLQDVAGEDVLVVGCSLGGVTPLARNGATVVGIDISDQAVAQLQSGIAKEQLERQARALVMNAENVDFPPASFDRIVCTGVLHHLDVGRAATSWARALKPKGLVTMIEPMAWNPLVALYRAATPRMRTADEHPLKPRDIRILRRHFAHVSVRGYALTSVLSVVFSFVPGLAGLSQPVCRFLEHVDNVLLTMLPPLKYLCWTAVIQCREPQANVDE
jgi:SAM-dependent methyltransferase